MANTTPFVLTQRKSTYPHDQVAASAPVVVKHAIFDAADVAAYKGSALALNDVTQLISIPAGAFVLTVTHKVITAEGGTFTYDIGDDATVDGYVAAGNGNTTTNDSSFNGTTTPTFGVGKYYAAANTIDLLVKSGTATKAVVAISVTYVMTAPAVIA